MGKLIKRWDSRMAELKAGNPRAYEALTERQRNEWNVVEAAVYADLLAKWCAGDLTGGPCEVAWA